MEDEDEDEGEDEDEHDEEDVHERDDETRLDQARPDHFEDCRAPPDTRPDQTRLG
jgi:hypothetical protein